MECKEAVYLIWATILVQHTVILIFRRVRIRGSAKLLHAPIKQIQLRP